ncbi:MAG: alpha/beta fold hydrolase [Xanthomonadales bacterium]|nr:2-(acetamidomethylene)succinate hydrolase [Xanthomonadales bacterium]MCC6592677.1 alpha/beta fold hydrolase [Xanthomonadales bacterium]MCE7930803.1 alpha/beta fold hydrolase [Xanthomonadales bacterium PRO6]
MESSAASVVTEIPAPRLRRYAGCGGLALAVEHYGPEDAPALLFAHGFGQNRHAWRSTATQLGDEGWHGLAIDGRGHGDSDWVAAGDYEFDHFAEDLAAIARTRDELPILIGASMGGLLGLLIEGESPSPVFRAMVLVDVTPRWETEGVGRILDFMAAHPQGFDSLQHAADEVARYLPHRERKDPERLRSQLREHADGRWRWHWDPRLLGRVAQQAEGYIPRLQAAARRVRIPLLLLSGGRSDVVSAHTIDEFLHAVPQAEHICIEDATHMVVGDRNDVFTREISRFLKRFA